MPKIKKPKSKLKPKYFNAGTITGSAGGVENMMGEGMKNIPGLGLLSSAPAFMQEAMNTRTVFGNSDSTKTQKADATLGSIGKGTEMVGDAIPIPGVSQIIKGVGKGIDMVGNIVGMFPGKDGKKQARDDANEQTRQSRFQSGTMFSKHGGNMDSPSTEYKILPSNKSKKTAPIQKLSKNMEIVSQKGTFSHNSNDDIPVDTNNDNQEDLRMEGGEIILKQKDGGQYMLNKQVSKVLKPKALALAKGDKISQNTLEKYLKPQAVKLNDANLVSKGLTDRLSMGNGGNTTGRTNIKSYVPGTPNKGAEVKKHGGKVKPSKYIIGGGFNQEDLVKNPTAISGFNFNESPTFKPKFSITSPDLYQNLKTNQITKDLQFNNHYNQANKITDPADFRLLKNESPSNKDGYKTANGVTQSNVTETEPGSFKAQQPWGSVAAQLAGTGLKALALKRHKTLPVKSEFIANELARKQGKAEGELLGAENESIQRVQGSVNKALDTTSYPSVQARLANNRNTIKAGASAEADVRSKFALGRSGLMSQNAATLAGVKSQNYFAQNDREQQNIDNKTNQWTKVAQDISNIGINSGYLMNGKRYNDAVLNSSNSNKYNPETGDYEFNDEYFRKRKSTTTVEKYGGKIKKPKKLK